MRMKAAIWFAFAVIASGCSESTTDDGSAQTQARNGASPFEIQAQGGWKTLESAAHCARQELAFDISPTRGLLD